MDIFVDFMNKYGLFAMFILIMIEYACFPISSEIVLPFSGAAAMLQGIPFYIMLPLSVLAGILGTSLCYAVGRTGGNALLQKITGRFPKSKRGIDSSLEKFNHYGTAAVCLGRLIPLCRTYIAFAAGVAVQPLPVFILASLIGITVWNSALLGLGYLLGNNWDQIGVYYQQYKHIIYIALGLILLSLILGRSRRNPRREDS